MQKNDDDYTDILSMVTHDLKSPLTAINGSFDFLSLDDLTEKEKKDAIKIGKKASGSLLKLIENILTMAKLEAGKEHIHVTEAIDIKIFLGDIIETFKYEAKIKQIKLKVKIDSNIPKKAYWDSDKLQYHVFNNIISNAMKFTPTDGSGKIELSIKHPTKTSLTIEIKDNGMGIPKSKQKNIFDKFDTFEDKKIFKGSGLGLFNSYSFIKKHHGTIEVIEGLENKGVGFKVTLPLNPFNL